MNFRVVITGVVFVLSFLFLLALLSPPETVPPVHYGRFPIVPTTSVHE